MKTLTQHQSLLSALALAIILSAPAAHSGAPRTDTSKPTAKEKSGIGDPKGAGVMSSGVELPPIPLATGSRKAQVASWGRPLPYPILIADRRNNRLIEIARDKRIVWEFPSPNLAVYSGNEDVDFSEDGKQLAVSEEDN